MKILTILSFTEITGVGTFNYTLLESIKKKYPKAKLYVYFKSKNKDSLLIRMFETLGCTILSKIPRISFDYVFTNYTEAERFGKKTIHFVHNLMASNYMNPNADKVCVMGERAYKFLNHNNKIMIRNAINLTRFKYIKPKRKLSKVLIFDSRNNAFLVGKVLAACSNKNIYLSVLGEDLNQGNVNRWNVEDYIKSSDLVVSVGRSAIESMAMGKQVLIANTIGANGLVTINNIKEHATTNFSGWLTNFNKQTDSIYFQKEIMAYNASNGYEIRKYIEQNFNIDDYIEKILD